jgi:hypothetical protein
VRTAIPTRLLLQLLNATPEQYAAVQNILGTPEKRQPAFVTRGKRGRLRFENDFLDLWLGPDHYDLRDRNKARFCIQYLFRQGAFDRNSACHFEKEIDPYVRSESGLEPLPGYAETKLHHYFNPSTGKFARLGRDLVRSAGRGSGRYFLNVD